MPRSALPSFSLASGHSCACFARCPRALRGFLAFPLRPKGHFCPTCALVRSGHSCACFARFPRALRGFLASPLRPKGHFCPTCASGLANMFTRCGWRAAPPPAPPWRLLSLCFGVYGVGGWGSPPVPCGVTAVTGAASLNIRNGC